MTSFKVSIRWPRTVTTKPKTSRQIQNTSRKTENLMPKTKTSRKPHDKNKIPHNKTKNLTVKPKTSQQKPNTSRQKQIPTAKPKLFCLICCEVLGFAMRYFVFAVRFLVLPWCFCFCLDSCGPPYSKGIKFRLEKQVVKKSSVISNCSFSVTMSVLL